MVLGVLRVFSTEKTHFLLKYLNYYRCMSNYGEIIGPSLNYGIKPALIYEFFVVNLPNSCVVLYWPVSTVLHELRSF